MTFAALRALRSDPGRGRVLVRLRLGLEVWRQRRALASLPPDRLDDIGLTEDQVRREVERRPWDVPQHWLR